MTFLTTIIIYIHAINMFLFSIYEYIPNKNRTFEKFVAIDVTI